MNAIAPLPFRPQAVLFDMDGLLLESERAIIGCLARAAGELGHDLPGTLWLAMIGNGEAVCRSMLHARIGESATAAVLEKTRALYTDIVEAGVPHRPGVRPLLDWLQENGLPRAVATSTRRPLALQKLQAAGLLEHFHAVCTSSDVARPKPAPDVYLLAAEKLAVPPARCLVLEDSPTGVRAALAAGMTAIQVPDMLPPDDDVRALGHRIVDSLHQVRQLLQDCPAASLAAG